MKLKQVLLDHKFHKLSRSLCFQKPNPNIFQSKLDISCSTAGFKDVAAGDRRKITKIAIESSEMVGFHFLIKEKKLQLKRDRMSYKNPGVNRIFSGQKLTFVSKLAQVTSLKIDTKTIKSQDPALKNRRDRGSGEPYLILSKVLIEFKKLLPHISQVIKHNVHEGIVRFLMPCSRRLQWSKNGWSSVNKWRRSVKVFDKT